MVAGQCKIEIAYDVEKRLVMKKGVPKVGRFSLKTQFSEKRLQSTIIIPKMAHKQPSSTVHRLYTTERIDELNSMKTMYNLCLPETSFGVDL